MSELKRTLSLTQTTLMGVGVMLGAGIYALVGQASLLAGNAVWLSFLLASLVATCTGLSYAELSSFIPKAGGEYYYTNRALGGLVAFLVSWQLVVGIAIGAATVSLAFAGYLSAMTSTNPVLTASLLIAAIAALLIYGIEQSARFAIFCTVLELIGLVIVMYVGLPELGSVDYFETASGGYAGVISAGTLIFFAYIGFEEVAHLAEETTDPRKNIPRALLLSIGITTILYVVVSACAVSVMGWEKLGASESPLADVVAIALGRNAFLTLSVIALFSTANTTLVLIMSPARLLYGMAQDGKMPVVLAKVHRTRKSPHVATLVVAGMAISMVVALEDIGIVASLTNFALLTAFVVINLAVVVLRFREPETVRPFRIAGRIGRLPVIPVFGIVTSSFLLSYVRRNAILMGLGLISVGFVVYLASVRSASRLRTDDTTR